MVDLSSSLSKRLPEGITICHYMYTMNTPLITINVWDSPNAMNLAWLGMFFESHP